MTEQHAEIKDTCQGLQTCIDEMAEDLRTLPTDYKIAERYMDIDDELNEVYEWYEERRKMFIRYEREREHVNKKLERLDTEIRRLNNDVQNLKLLEFSRAQHEASYSQLSRNRHQ